MKKFITLVVAICLAGSITQAQETYLPVERASKKIQFSSIQQVSVIANEEQTVPGFQVIVGAKYKRYFLGVGIGVDPYFATSFPKFIDARYTYFDQRFSSYVYGDLGMNKITNAGNRYPATWENGQQAYTLQRGLYYEYGIGIKTRLAGNVFYNCSMGISFKESKYNYTYYSWPSQNPLLDRYRNVASRFVIKMGIQF